MSTGQWNFNCCAEVDCPVMLFSPAVVSRCTADCGWITGHSYLTYGPLLNGASVVVFEGVPTHPDAGRCWEVVDKWGPLHIPCDSPSSVLTELSYPYLPGTK